jgi:uncharacterized membrane protein
MPSVEEPRVLPDQDVADRLRKVELIISYTLRIGVIVSISIVLLGTLISFTRHPDYTTSAEQLTRLTQPGAAFPHTLNELSAGLARFRGQAIVGLGLLLLIVTPVLRVAISIVAFIFQRDPTFVIITSTVLILLLLSFVLGHETT